MTKIGSNLLAREAIAAALEARRDSVSRPNAFAETLGSKQAADPSSIGDAIGSGLQEVNTAIQRAEGLDRDLATGKVQDFHEIAVQVKQADLSLRFALEVRNRLVDAYREVMRMSI